MPLKLNFKRTHRYNVSAKDLFVIPIYTLDASCIEYTVSPTTTGRDALEYVAQRLDFEDTCFFGFRYEAWADDQRWLFLNKPLKKQLDKYARQHALVLNIMLFIDNPQYLPDSKLRRQFYLQLRQDVLTKQLKLASKQIIKLMAYSLQAEYGDFVDFESTAHLWRERPMVPPSILGGTVELGSLEHIDDIIWGYCQLRGVSQENVIWHYLEEIRKLPSYGVQLFFGSTASGDPAQLGVSRNGLTISRISPINSTVSKLKWEDIKDLAYSRKTFTIQHLKKAKPILFVFKDTQDSRYLWNFCIQIHNSYIHHWTHIKDVLRGNAVTLPTSASSPTWDFGRTSPKFSSKCGSDTSGVVVNNSNSTTTVGSVASIHATGTSGFPSAQQQSGANLPLSSSLPVSGFPDTCLEAPSPEQAAPIALPVASNMHEDSDGGTLVGQWSVRSCADTLDSQMVANPCVACLSVTNCLRKGPGMKAAVQSLQPQSQMERVTSPRKRHHHHRKHRLPPSPHSYAPQSNASAQEVAARYNMSLTESTSGSSSESEFHSDVGSTSAETSSSSTSSRRGEEDGHPRGPQQQQQQQHQQHGFRRLISGAHTGVAAAVSLRPILSGFNQHHYRLQQNRREEERAVENRRGSLRQKISGTLEGKSSVVESHGWLASARRLTSALSESLTRRALSTNPVAVGKATPPLHTTQLLTRGSKSVGIAQVIRPEPPSTVNATNASLEGGVYLDDGRRRPTRPPLPAGGGTGGGAGGQARHTPHRGASAGPTTSATTASKAAGSASSSSYPLHHSLYEVPAEARLQVSLKPPSPPGSQEETSWLLVRHPAVWSNQMPTNGQSESRQQVQQPGYFEIDVAQPSSTTQLAVTSSSMTSSSTSTSTSSAAAVAAAVSAIRSNSSSPSSPASSIVEDEIISMMMMGADKEDDSSSTMSYLACDVRGATKTAAIVAPIQRTPQPVPPPPQQQQQQQQRPVHLLTNSDIHQLLNLTKMRETALVHRLLAEYRQTLLLQQTLHTNSMSTPNLAASQELHTATNGSLGNHASGGSISTAAPPSAVESNSRLRRCNALRCKTAKTSSRDFGQCHHSGNAPHCCHQTPRSHHISDSSDYVNASAFQCHPTCTCDANQMQTSAHSTTDNDSNATFRVLSEADAGRSHYPSSHQCNHHRRRRHHHEDSCTNNIDEIPSSSCLQQGGTKSIVLTHQDRLRRLSCGRSQNSHEICKSATPEDICTPTKGELPQQTFSSMHESLTERSAGDFPAINGTPQISSSFGCSKTFTIPQSSNLAMRVAFLRSQEYENFEVDSPPLSSVNPKSTTDVSAKSSSSDISFDDYADVKFGRRPHCRNVLPPMSAMACQRERIRHKDHDHRHCQHHGHRRCTAPHAAAIPSKRSTLPSISCDGGNEHIQLCREHFRALELLQPSKEVHVDTPMIPRRKPKKKTQNHEQPRCSCCSDIALAPRYTVKARSHDPYKPKQNSHRPVCSACPTFTCHAVDTRCDLCRRQWRLRENCRRCECACNDLLGGSDEEEEGDLIFSRAASDSSLTSFATHTTTTKDVASIMVSSYEFECQPLPCSAESSFDSVGERTVPHRCRNKPSTPRCAIETSSRTQQHVNFFDTKNCPVTRTGRVKHTMQPPKSAISPLVVKEVSQQAVRPKTLLSGSFQTAGIHQVTTPSIRYGTRPEEVDVSSSAMKPVSGIRGVSRTSTPSRSTAAQLGYGDGETTPRGGGGLLFTASMTFTPSSSTPTSEGLVMGSVVTDQDLALHPRATAFPQRPTQKSPTLKERSQLTLEVQKGQSIHNHHT